VEIAGVSASHVAVEDVNGDGLDDLICQFSTKDLVDAGALDLTDTTLAVEATLPDGACIRGFDQITVKK